MIFNPLILPFILFTQRQQLFEHPKPWLFQLSLVHLFPAVLDKRI